MLEDLGWELVGNFLVGAMTLLVLAVAFYIVVFALTSTVMFIGYLLAIACLVILCLFVGMIVVHFFAWLGLSI